MLTFAPLPQRLESALARGREVPRVLREGQANLVAAEVPPIWATVALDQAAQAPGLFLGPLLAIVAEAAPGLQATGDRKLAILGRCLVLLYDMAMEARVIPACQARIEIEVSNSRFIATGAPAFGVEEARAVVARVRDEFSDATHNVPAFLIGHGSSVIAHCHDDGEPTGTAGRPALAVLQGSGLGDVVVVVTRYFGGTKLGTGGLVRAYGDAVRALLDVLPRAQKVATHTILIVAPYPAFERVCQAIESHGGETLDQNFAAEVTLTARFPVEQFEPFQSTLQELSAGQIEAAIVDTQSATIMPLRIPAA